MKKEAVGTLRSKALLRESCKLEYNLLPGCKMQTLVSVALQAELSEVQRVAGETFQQLEAEKAERKRQLQAEKAERKRQGEVLKKPASKVPRKKPAAATAAATASEATTKPAALLKMDRKNVTSRAWTRTQQAMQSNAAEHGHVEQLSNEGPQNIFLAAEAPSKRCSFEAWLVGRRSKGARRSSCEGALSAKKLRRKRQGT